MGRLALVTVFSLALGGLALAEDGDASEEFDLAAEQAAAPQTPAGQLQAARIIARDGQLLSKRISHALNSARKNSDIILVTCLNDKLTQINAHVHNVEDRLVSLEEAVDPEQATHEYTVIATIGDKLETLEQEAAQCAGQDLYDTGSTRVVTEIDTSMLPFEDNPGFPPLILPPGLPTFPPPASGRR